MRKDKGKEHHREKQKKTLGEIIKIMNDDHHMGYQRTGEKREDWHGSKNVSEEKIDRSSHGQLHSTVHGQEQAFILVQPLYGRRRF